MDQQQWMNLFLFFAILLGSFLIYKYLENNNYLKQIEGMENKDAKTSGIASGADTFILSLKEKIDKLKDELLVSNYQAKYKDIVINTDDWLNYFMLKSVLIAQSPEQAMPALIAGSLSRMGLNNVIKFIDRKK